MSDEKQLDRQDASEVKNYTRIPNMLIFGYSQISPQEKWLLVCLKHLCGKRGTRHLSLRYISEQTGISTGALSKSKDKNGKVNEGMIAHLHQAGLIHSEIRKHEGRGNPQFHITITDTWQLNQSFFETRSDFGRVLEEVSNPIRISDKVVRNLNGSVRNSDEPVRNPVQYQDYIQDSNKITDKIPSLVASATQTHTDGQSAERNGVDDGQLADTQETLSISLSMADEVSPISTLPTAETIPASDARQQTLSQYRLHDAEKPIAHPTGKTSQASGKHGKDKPVEVPQGPLVEPDMSGAWDNERVVQYAEWCNGRRYEPTSKMRASQLKAAAKLHKEDSMLTMLSYKKAHDERNDDWWKEHKRVLHVSDMAAKDNSGIVRVYAMLDRLETQGVQKIQRATLNAQAQPARNGGVYNIFYDTTLTPEEIERQVTSEFYNQEKWEASLRKAAN